MHVHTYKNLLVNSKQYMYIATANTLLLLFAAVEPLLMDQPQ